MNERRVSAIVLAGGRSSRFGRDKLAEPIDGRPLLHHAIDAVRPFAMEVLVVVSPEAPQPTSLGVIVVRDPTPFEGPLAGLLAGLVAARERAILVVGGDMPDPLLEVVEMLLGKLDEAGVEAVVLEHDGRARPLPMVLRRDTALAAATRLMAAGERRLGALPEALATTVVAEAAWRALDPVGRTVRDIDTPADLHQPPRSSAS